MTLQHMTLAIVLRASIKLQHHAFPPQCEAAYQAYNYPRPWHKNIQKSQVLRALWVVCKLLMGILRFQGLLRLFVKKEYWCFAAADYVIVQLVLAS